MLKIVMEQKTGTPYWGIIAETGVWPYKYIVKYKQLMFSHNLINSSDTRVAKKILLQQSYNNYENNYYNEIKNMANKMGIQYDIETMHKTSINPNGSQT